MNIYTSFSRLAIRQRGLTMVELMVVLAVAAILVGLAIPLAVSLSVSTTVRDIAIWGVATLALQLLVFRIVDLILTGLPQRIQNGEVSAAVVLAGAKLATALILSAALTG